MTTDHRRLERLARAARGRSERLAQALRPRGGEPAGPGDLFVLQATAGLPVEWAVLEREPDGRWLAVPADAGPRAGSADVEVAAGEPGGPLSLRCRFAASLGAALLSPELRTGRLAEEAVAEALHRVRQIASGVQEPSPLEEEVDADPEYQDWVRDVLAPAHKLASQAGRRKSSSPGTGGWTWGHRLAAVLALASIGLGFWVARLQREVDQLAAPIFNAPTADVTLGAQERGRTVVRVPREASRVVLRLIVALPIEPQDGYFEITDRSGKEVWRSGPVRLVPGGELVLILAHKDLPYGDYRVRVFPASGFDARPLAEETLRIGMEE
ncbi:MAG: hypothetical protein ACJ75H_11780 [Thermoanaerobaculia bacterium]